MPKNPKNKRESEKMSDPLSTSAVRKTTRVLNRLTANERKIAINVFKYVEKTLPTYPYRTQVTKITSEIMRTSERSIQNIINAFEKNGTIPIPVPNTGRNLGIIKKLDKSTLRAIRRKILQLSSNGVLPSINKVRDALKDDPRLPTLGRSTSQNLIKKLFKYEKYSKKIILDGMEYGSDTDSNEGTEDANSYLDAEIPGDKEIESSSDSSDTHLNEEELPNYQS